MKPHDLDDLQTAVSLLENPGWAAKIANLLGSPIEKAVAILPAKASAGISKATHKAIEQTLSLSLKTLDYHDPQSTHPLPTASNWWHMAAAAGTGAVGGAFGLLALTMELPLSTTIIMRSIADIARSQGSDLADPQTRLECMQILALGGRPGNDDAAEVGYFAAREAMSAAIADASTFLAKHGLQRDAPPVILSLITRIAERYSITVTEKAAAQLVPIIGAVSGAVINTLFINHFQNMARGHFIVRRLENQYGVGVVEKKYRELQRLQQSAREARA